jgi:dolichol kinase|tara:strand:+ start:1370 stop:1504 length:135 start_codon:yes stop_codon:yes gene_type:complete
MSTIKKDLKRLGLIVGKKKTRQMSIVGIVSTVLVIIVILSGVIN